MNAAIDLPAAIAATTYVATIGVMIASVEDLVGLKLVRPGGLLSWDVLKLQGSWSVRGWSGRVSAALFDYGGSKVLLAMRLIGGSALLIAYGSRPVFLIATLAILLSLVALSLRAVYGLDGAHQMYVVIFGALFLGGVAGQDSIAGVFSVWFIALQAGMSYLIAGLNKLVSPLWRNGEGLTGILGTRVYGHPVAYAMVSGNALLAKTLSWTIIVFECCFCLVFLVNPDIALSILLAGTLFHLTTAVIMGLNGFFFAFVATYPCIAYTVSIISS